MSDERPMAKEHIWQDDGETLRATGNGGWYREGEDWRRVNPDWFARFARLELLRAIAQRDALGKGLLAVLRHCDIWPEGETEFERAVIAARSVLRGAGLLPEEGA